MQPLTLSGPSLSDLTLRAEKERGAPPKRVSAVEKGVRRSGGLFGFFQREQEIVTITFEWDDQEPIAPALEERLEDALVAPPWSRAMASLLEDADETGDVVELAVAATAGREHVQAGGGSRTTFREELNRQAAALGDPGDRDDAVEAELRDLLQEREEYERRSTQPGALVAEHPFAQDDLARMEIAAGADSALRALRTAGYPATLMAQLVSSTGAPTFEDAFTIVPMPRPLPTTAGSLVAVVGPGSAAIDAAREIARDVHLEADEIALASRKRRRAVRSDLTVRNPRSAGDLAPGWRRGRVGVVAVACDGLADLSWVRSILSSVRPSYVLLVGRADAKSSDLSAIAERIGGVDALVLEGLSETLTPLAALDTGIPIARLDNTTANPSAWTDVLERAAELGEGTG